MGKGSKRRELSDESSTASLASAVWRELSEALATSSSGLSIALLGPLGAGKTTFVRGIGVAAGLKEDVTSPTYVLQHEYEIGEFVIEHWDLYRLKGEYPEELTVVPEKGVVRLIEWCDRFPELLAEQDGALQFFLEINGDDFLRKVSLEGVLEGVVWKER